MPRGAGRRSSQRTSRGRPADALAAALATDGPADLALRQYFSDQPQWGARDRRQIRDRCFSVLRHLRSLQTALAAAGQPADDASALWLLAQARFDGDALSNSAGPDWLAPALQAIASEASVDHARGLRFDLPDWLVDGLLSAVGASQFPALAESLLGQGSLDLRVNLSRRGRVQVQAALAEEGIAAVVPDKGVCPPALLRVADAVSIERTAVFQRGDIEIQDAGSQLLARLSGARRQETIVDLCAGAGGKTLAMADMTRDTGNLYACDQSARRLARLQPRVQRAGLRSVRPMSITSENDPRLDRLAGRADLVLIDAPCSGTGTLRRSPWVKWQLTPERVAQLVQVQQSLLQAGARLLRPGGRLVYATCSLLVEENEAVAEYFEAGHPGFVRQDLATRAALGEAAVRPAVLPAHAGYCRVWPHLDHCDGYFVAGWTAPTG